MKNRKIMKLSFPLAVLLFIGGLLTGCSKEAEVGVVPGGETQLIFKVDGTEGARTVILANAAYGSVAQAEGIRFKNSSVTTNSEGVSFGTYTAEVDLNSGQSADEPVFDDNGAQYPSNGQLSSPMESNVKYRVLIYAKKTGKLVSSVLAEAGVPISVPVVKGGEYDWYAVSYNTKDDNLDVADPNNPKIRSQKNKELLYDKGTIASVLGERTIGIKFKHQLVKLSVEINTGNFLADIKSVGGVFGRQDYFQTGELELKSGNMGNLSAYTIDPLQFNPKDGNKRLYRSSAVYTAKRDLKSFSFIFNNLQVNRGGNDITLITESSKKEQTYSGFKGGAGSEMIGRTDVYKSIRKLRILHAYDTKNMTTTNYKSGSHAAAQGASFNFLRNKNAFGPSKDARVMVDDFEHFHATKIGDIERLIRTESPDIIIYGEEFPTPGVFGGNGPDLPALKTYVDRGGVLIMFSDEIYSGWPKQFSAVVKPLTGATSETPSGVGVANQGQRFETANIDDPILNGVFGDARNQSWGADLGRTLFLRGVQNKSDIISYSNGRVAGTSKGESGSVTMLRHRNKNFFWVGDGGFLANPDANGEPTHTGENKPGAWTHAGHLPFATNKDNMPVVLWYGSDSPKANIYNSIIFGNVMAWAIEQAAFSGINK